MVAKNWWDRHVGEDTSIETFKGWVSDHTAASKVYARRLVQAMEHKSFLDCGAGLCSEYDGYREDGYDIDYRALDQTVQFVKMARDRCIPVTEGSIENIPHEDGEFDVVYTRHVLEHLPYYEKAIAEMVRVASKEAIIVWFIPPHEGDEPDEIRVMDGDLYHNSYNRAKLEEFIRGLPGVAMFDWTPIGDREVILAIEKERVE